MLLLGLLGTAQAAETPRCAEKIVLEAVPLDIDYRNNRARFREVVLHPVVRIANAGDLDRARSLHRDAHHECFIANSVNFDVRHKPSVTAG